MYPHVRLIASVPDYLQGDLKHRGRVFLKLGIISGSIWGSPMKKPVWFVDLDPGAGPALDMVAVGSILRMHAATSDDPSVVVRPTGTKLARMSTFGLDRRTGQMQGGKFMDASGNALMLVYFDRACVVQRDIQYGGYRYITDLNIPAAGMYWLSQDTMKLKRHTRMHEPVRVAYVRLMRPEYQ